MELVDEKLESDYNEEEVMVMINVALLCADVMPSVRPPMSSVVSIPEGGAIIEEFISDASQSRKIKEPNPSSSDTSIVQSLSIHDTCTASSTSTADLYPVAFESEYWKSRDHRNEESLHYANSSLGENTPTQLRRKRTTSSCVSQQNEDGFLRTLFLEVSTTSPQKYSVYPNTGLIKSNSTSKFTVTLMQDPSIDKLGDIKCQDKFLIMSTPVRFLANQDDYVTPALWTQDSASYVQEDIIWFVLDGKPNSPPLDLAKEIELLEAMLNNLQEEFSTAKADEEEGCSTTMQVDVKRGLCMGVTTQVGATRQDIAAKVDEYAHGIIVVLDQPYLRSSGSITLAPLIYGHNIDDLIAILKGVEVKSTKTTGPVLIHVISEKGRGYPYAEKAADKYHGVAKFDPATGKQSKATLVTQSYTTYFAEALIAEEAERDQGIVGIHAAMGGGTGMNLSLCRFPTRCFDVGIAEQHAVTFAAGLARESLKPFFHDVDLQKLPVRFALDRAGLAGADGPTHAGSFDVAYMACLPNMVVMAPSDEAELFHMVATAAAIDDRPSCFRYPRGNGVGVKLPPGNKGIPFEVGKGRVLIEGERVALFGYGTAVQSCLAALWMPAFCKPLNYALIRSIAKSHEFLITVEEGSTGGFGSDLAQFMALDGLLDGNTKWRPLVPPDRYIDHGSPADQLVEAGLSVSHNAATVFDILGQKREAPEIMS
ncbi:hypothetical protein ACET3Z_026903 [Daucus carota]